MSTDLLTSSSEPRPRVMGAGKIVARSVEVNLTAHCNLACYGCDHASPVHAEEYLSVEEFAKDLAALAPVYHVFEFLLTGGEPLLHPRLLDVVDTIRASGVTEKITMMTNGVLLHKAPEALFGKIDKIGVSVYPGVNRKLDERQIRDLAARHGLLLWYKPTDEFTKKLLHGENRDTDLVQTIYSTCTLRNSCHTIHKGRYYKCSPSPFLPDWLERLGIDPTPLESDGVPVRDNPRLRQQLAAYLTNEKPLAACSYCLGCVGKTVPMRQMNKTAALQWVSEKDPDVRDLIDWDEVANAGRELEGMELTGLLPNTTAHKMRWQLALWAKQFLGVELKQSF